MWRRLEWKVRYIFHIVFGCRYWKAIDDYAKNNKDCSRGKSLGVGEWYFKSIEERAKRVRKIRWWMGNPIIVQDSLIGSYKQIVKRLPGIWEHSEIADFFGVDWKTSEDLIELDLIRFRQRKIELVSENKHVHWYKPVSRWFQCATTKSKLGIFQPYDSDYWWEVT